MFTLMDLHNSTLLSGNKTDAVELVRKQMADGSMSLSELSDLTCKMVAMFEASVELAKDSIKSTQLKAYLEDAGYHVFVDYPGEVSWVVKINDQHEVFVPTIENADFRESLEEVLVEIACSRKAVCVSRVIEAILNTKVGE